MKSQIKEQGSIAHITIVIVLVVALLSALGFIFWQNFLRSGSSDMSTGKNGTSQSAQKDNVEIVPVDPNKDYLVVDSWSVRFKPNVSAKVSYESKDDGYWFTTEKWKNFGGICDTNGGILVQRSTEKSTAMASPPRPLNNEEKIGDYYYYYIGPQSACSDDHTSEEPSEYQIVRDLLSTIEAKK